MKKAVGIIIVVIIGVLIFLQLRNNHQQIKESTSLAERRIDQRPVRVYEVKPLSAPFSVQIPGKFIAESELTVTAATQGRIIDIPVKKGEWLRKGQVIAQVDDALLREQYNVAAAAYEKLSADAERYRIMAEEEAITGQQYAEVKLRLRQVEAEFKSAEKQLNETSVISPIAGYLNQIFIKEGSMLGPGVPVCEIVNTNNLKLQLRLSAEEREQVSGFSGVRVLAGSDTLKGTVSFMGRKPDFTNRFELEVAVDNINNEIYAGREGTALFSIPTGEQAIFVPRKAILGYGESEFFVYSVSEGKAVKNVVSKGGNEQDMVRINAGISYGTLVITEGNTLVEEGQPVTIVPK